MDNIAVHMRITGVAVTDTDVDSRRAAATSLASSWKKEKSATAIIAKAADIAAALGGDGNPPPSLGGEIEKVIQKKSSSFLYQERPLEIGVCAGMAMVSILAATPGNNGWTVSDVFGNALWSAMEYQPVIEGERRETLRREVLDAAKNWATASAEKSRERTEVPDPSTVTITIDENNAATNNFKGAVTDTVEALRRNAALDREELDFLWWAQLGRSRLLNKPQSVISEPTRIVAAGIEGARMLRRLPCEVHREIVLRTLDQDPELDMAEMLGAIGNDRAALAAEFNVDNILAHPAVFPFLHALVTGDADGPGAALKRRASEWGARTLLEAGFLKMISQGVGRL